MKRAADRPGKALGRDPADQLIYATAVEHDAVLVSRDGVIRDLDPRRVVW